MLVAEIYKYEDGMRSVETRQYRLRDDLDKRIFWLNMRGQWVGHKIWNCDKRTYNQYTDVEKAQNVAEQKFDKEAYIRSSK
jgi:hypothetical protein